MRKITSFIIMLMLPLMACSADYSEGEQYTKVSDEVSRKVEVREYFSFYCPHCFQFEPLMSSVKKQLPADVDFEMNHVDFLRAASPKIQQMLSRALVVAQQMDMEHKMVNALFNYIHVQKAIITEEKDLRNIFVLNGADGDKFDKLMKSFSVNSKAKLMKKNQDELSKSKGITSVPTVIVNGKYRINHSKLDRDNFEADLNKLVKYLLTLD